MKSFKKFVEDYKYKDAPTVGKFLDLNDIEGDPFNRKMDAYTWDKFLKDAHEGRLPSWFDHSDTAARDMIWEYAKKKAKMNDKDFAEYVKASITWWPGVSESKTIKEAVLPTENEGWGFFGTGNTHNTYDQMKVFWDYTSKQLAQKLRWTPKDVQWFLDSRGGRHFADSITDLGPWSFRHIDKAIQDWQSRDWFNSWKE